MPKIECVGIPVKVTQRKTDKEVDRLPGRGLEQDRKDCGLDTGDRSHWKGFMEEAKSHPGM